MKLKFEINKYELVAQVFRLRYKYPDFLKYWESLEKRLISKYKNEPAFYLLYLKYNDWGLRMILFGTEKKNFKKSFGNAGLSLEKISLEIFKSREFLRTYSETEKYLNEIKKQWKKNEKCVFNYFEKILGLNLNNQNIKIYIFHPDIYNGRSESELNIILWSHPEEWKNYNSVYIAHEILHILLDNKISDGEYEIMHTIIELATDYELKKRLNEKGGDITIGHEYLLKNRKRLLPHWNEYIKNPTNILDFYKKAKKILKK